MALIIEDGSVVVSANSYVTDSEYTAWATLNQFTLSDTAGRESAAVKAYNLITSDYESGLSGYRIEKAQTGAFPRSQLVVRGFDVDSDEIPNDIKNAQMMLMANIIDGAATNGFTSTSESGQLTSMEVVGVYKESYQAGTASGDPLTSFPAVDKVLAPYMSTTGRGGTTGKMERV